MFLKWYLYYFVYSYWVVLLSGYDIGLGRFYYLKVGLEFGNGKICKDNFILGFKDRDKMFFINLFWGNNSIRIFFILVFVLGLG